MKTNIVIDTKLLDLAMKVTGLEAENEVVEEGLKVLIHRYANKITPLGR